MSKDIEQKPARIISTFSNLAANVLAHPEKLDTQRYRQLEGEAVAAIEQYATERVIAELEQLLTREWSIDANDLRRYIIERQATLRGGTTNE